VIRLRMGPIVAIAALGQPCDWLNK